MFVHSPRYNTFTFPLMSVLKILWYKEAMDISYEPSAKALLEKYQSKVLTEQTKNDQGPRKVTTKNGDKLLDGTIKKKNVRSD